MPGARIWYERVVDIDTVREGIAALRDAEVVRQLTSGPLADKWRIRTAAADYIVRIDRVTAAAAGLDRAAELAALEALADSAWCPHPLFVDADRGILVMPWVAGEPWPADRFADPHYLQQLACLLFRLHSAPIRLPAFALDRRNRQYAEFTGDAAVRQRAMEVEELLAQADTSSECPCHNDPVAGNVLAMPEPCLIDFEFAAAGNAHFDLAAIIEHHGLDAQERAGLIDAYRAAGGSPDPEILELWRRIYGLTAANWDAVLIFGQN